MDPRTRMSGTPDREAAEFVRFCRDRRRVGWPELYDEMCVVATHRLFRWYGYAELWELGIWFSLFGTTRLAATGSALIADELQAVRRGALTARCGVAVVSAVDEGTPVTVQ